MFLGEQFSCILNRPKRRLLQRRMWEFPPFRLDTVNQCLWRREDKEDERISLTPKAFAMLNYLVEHPGRLITQDELLEALWPGTFVQPEVLKSHILDLRSALGDDARNPRFIQTLPRRGYQFIAAVSDPAAEAKLTPELPSRKLVGRDAALAELKQCVERSSQNHRQIVFITGEPGIGKTTVTDEFLRRSVVDFPGLRIARGQCVEGYGSKEAYYPVLEAVGQLCSGSVKHALVQILAEQAPTWLVQFPSLVRREQRQTLQREILGATRERMLREICEALETIASEKPLCLVLEDLHWADPSTVDLISALARRRASGKLMLIGTYRPVDVALAGHPLKTLKQDLLLHHLCHEIALEPLQESEVAEYLALETPEFSVPEGLAELIYRHSEGNPMFMVAALDHMCDRSLIALEEGSWQIKVPLEKIDLAAPESLRQMIELQIERLSPEEQRVLEVASALRKFPLSVTMAAAVSKMEPDTVEELLEGVARRHQVISPAGFRDYKTGTSPCYEFVHVLYRDVLYSRIGSSRKRKLHLSIAESGEALDVSFQADVAAEGAYQFEQGGDWQRAVKYLLLAADTAGRRFEPRQATEILEHALELVNKIQEADRSKSEIEILQKLAGLYSAMFDPRSVELYETLRTRAAHYGLLDVEIRALLDMAIPLANFSGLAAYNSALDRVRAAQLRSQEEDTPQQAAIRSLYLGRVMSMGGGSVEGLEQCKEAVSKVREVGDPRLLGEALIGLAYYLRNYSEYRPALQCAEEGFEAFLANYEANPHLGWIFHVYTDLTFSSGVFLGAWGDTLRQGEEHFEAIRKSGSFMSKVAETEKLFLQIHAMDFVGARQFFESNAPILMSIPTVRRHCLIFAGAADVGLGNPERALEHLMTSKNEMDHQPMMVDWYHRMPLQWAMTEAWLSGGSLEKARMEAEEFLRISLATGERTYRALAYEVNIRIAMAESHLDRAQGFLNRALHEMEGYEVPLAHWRVHGTAAELHRIMGNRDLAERHRESGCATIMKLANSLPADEPLRKTFLSALLVRRILGDSEIEIPQSKPA
jgi:DNA-binding winged helix-turn-helix (wHTH) protein/tetratricopeptide (TPR) repeat protein